MNKSSILGIRTGVFGVNTWILPLIPNLPFVLVVDPAASRETRDDTSFISYFKKNNLLPVAVLLTHGHFDHIAGTKCLKEAFPDIKIAVHKDDLMMAGSNAAFVQKEILCDMGLEGNVKSLENLPEPEYFLSDGKSLLEVFDGFKDLEEKIASFGEKEKSAGSGINLFSKIQNALQNWKVISTPGHTKGSVCIYNEAEKLLISGDTIFYGGYGRTDLSGGSEIELQKSLIRLEKIISPDVLVFPGHDAAGFPFSAVAP